MNNFGLRLATEYLRSSDPQELLCLMEGLLPTLIAALSPQERVQFLKAIIQNHLEALLEGVSVEERATLLEELLPALGAVFALPPETQQQLLSSRRTA